MGGGGRRATPARGAAGSCSGGYRRWAATGGAAAVELQPVTIDLVAIGGGDLSHQACNGALVQVLDVAAGDPYQVVVIAAPADAISEASVLQEDAANDVHVGEQAHGPEDSGAADGAGPAREVLHREVAAVGEPGGGYGQAGGGDPVALGLKSADDGFQFGHGGDTREQWDRVSK